MKFGKDTMKHEIMPMVVGGLMTIGGMVLLGRGLYYRGRHQEMHELCHLIWDEGKVDLDIFDNTGRLFCIATEYLGD